MKGLVIRNTGSWYTVKTDEGRQVDCKIKGNFRLKGIRSTNPVAVGDRVEIVPNNEGTAFITAIEERRNYIIRKSPNLSKQSHIIAANVDQAMLVVTVNRPQTSTTFIDRFLASAEAYRVPVVMVFNKTDILDDDERRYQEMVIALYENIGYECRAVSAATGSGIDGLRELLAGKITVLSGNSGVGKSTLINSILPGANLRTAEISDAHNTGMHTTTFSEMLPLPRAGGSPSATQDSNTDGNVHADGYIIDTPGIKVFLTRTVPFGLFFRPYLYIEAIGLEATTRQFVHHHRAVHSSREQHGYLLFHNIVCCIHIIKTSICTYDCMKRHDEKT